MIELNEFDIPVKDFFRLTFWTQIAPSFWVWVYLTVFLFAVFVIILDKLVCPTIMSVVLAVLLLGAAYFKGRYYTYLAKNNIVKKRKMTFGNDMYRIVRDDGAEAQSPVNDIFKADVLCGYYRIFVNTLLFSPFPATAFRSEEDRIRFETEILGDKLQRHLIP